MRTKECHCRPSGLRNERLTEWDGAGGLEGGVAPVADEYGSESSCCCCCKGVLGENERPAVVLLVKLTGVVCEGDGRRKEYKGEENDGEPTSAFSSSSEKAKRGMVI